MALLTFDELYKKLNPAQRRAVDTIEGPVMVIAGPGTGKTQVLTLRIANILRRTDTPPDAILALTFTESGVHSMRERLLEIIGSVAYKVHIATFHGFANDVIKRYPEEFPRIIGAANISTIDQIRIMEEVLKTADISVLRPYGDPLYYLYPALRAIGELKRENIDPKKFKKLVRDELRNLKKLPDLYYEGGPYEGMMRARYKEVEKRILRDKELAIVYEAYQALLAKNRLYDYEDMLMEVIRALETNEDLRLRIQEQYHYILADEHQDANNAQNRLLELLAEYHEEPNLFIVGDENQAIYRFQGASLENFLYFKNIYPEATLVHLDTSYRSIQNILNSAHSLIAKRARGVGMSAALRADLDQERRLQEHVAREAREMGGIKVYPFRKPEVEYFFLASDIVQKITHGVAPQNIAILYRDNRDSFEIIRMLEKFKVPFVIESEQNILDDVEIRKLITILRGTHYFGDDTYLVPLLHINFLGMKPLDVYKIVAHAKKNKLSAYEIIKSKDHLRRANVEEREKFTMLYDMLARWNVEGHNKNLLDFFEMILQDSGFLGHVLVGDLAMERMGKINRLFDEIKSLVLRHPNYRLRDFMSHLELLTSHNMFLKKNYSVIPQHAVRLMTAHRSKGLEFDYVYIVNAYDMHWGNRKQVEHFYIPPRAARYRGNTTALAAIEPEDSNDDERRLFYVAMTRARKGVMISYAKEGPRGEYQLPSQFITELEPAYVQEINTVVYEERFQTYWNMYIAPKTTFAVSIKDKKFLNDLFLSQGITPHGLSTYLRCPWDYFYNFLLRVPKTPGKFEVYSSTVRDTLKEYFDHYREGEELKDTILRELLQGNLKKYPLSDREFKELMRKGEKAVLGYLDFYNHDFRRNVLTRVMISDVALGATKLKGVIDKLEFMGPSGEVNAVSYTTTKPKSRNALLGKTKNSAEEYKRALVFYKLLLDRYRKGRYKMVSGDIDFLEPNDRGKYKREHFEITSDEVKKLEGTITDVSREILGLKFWNRRCDDRVCAFCKLREAMGEHID